MKMNITIRIDGCGRNCVICDKKSQERFIEKHRLNHDTFETIDFSYNRSEHKNK